MNKWTGLAALIPALAMAFMDQTILPVALPTIQRELGESNTALQWTVNSYLLTTAIIQFVLMITVFRAIYFQSVMGYTPMETGLLTFVSTVPVLFLALLGGYLSDKIGPKIPIGIGYLLLIFSSIWFWISPMPQLISLLVPLLAFGMGIPLIFTPSYSSAMSALPPKKMGNGFGILATVRTLFATLGVALISTFVEISQESYLNLPMAKARGFLTGLTQPSRGSFRAQQ